MVLDPIPQPLPVHFLGSRPQPPTSLKDLHLCVCKRETNTDTYLCILRVCERRQLYVRVRLYQKCETQSLIDCISYNECIPQSVHIHTQKCKKPLIKWCVSPLIKWMHNFEYTHTNNKNAHLSSNECIPWGIHKHTQECIPVITSCVSPRGGGLGSRPKKMYGKRLGDGVEYHLMSPTPRC